jgi:hypothetical protein
MREKAIVAPTVPVPTIATFAVEGLGIFCCCGLIFGVLVRGLDSGGSGVESSGFLLKYL